MKKSAKQISTLILSLVFLSASADTVKPVIENNLADKTDSCWVVEVQLQTIFVDNTTATDDSSSIGSGLSLSVNPASAQGGAEIDTRFQGTVSVLYTATDPSGNMTTQCVYYVVRDFIPPVIDLRTPDTVTHCVNTAYTSISATVTDNIYDVSQISLTQTSSVNPYVIGTYEDVYVATDPAGNTTTKVRVVNVIDCETAQRKEIDQTSFTVYPNPSSNNITIKSFNDRPIEFIEIINSIGQLSCTQHINGHRGLVDISTLSSGFYTLNIVTDGVSTRKQLIKE